tara:strand:+ start:767 stop:2098 length:1332 start_codon:yes stop_codon:yes gene_type:complete
MNLVTKQLNVVTYVRSYLKKIKKQNISEFKSVFCYFSTWAPCPGLSKLRSLEQSFFGNLSLFFSIFKGIISISRQSNFKIINNKIRNKKTKLIVTWAYKNNFLPNGSLQDRYFNTNSRIIKEAVWYVIYMDEEIPKKIDKNIILLYNKNFFFKYNLFYLIKIIYQNFLRNGFSIKKIFHSLSSNITISNLIVDSVNKEIETERIEKLIIPYEAQPFQRNLINEFKRKNKKVITIGYVHDVQALPVHYAPLEGLPDILLLHSLDQKKYLIKYLKWPKKNIKLIPSMRFIQKSKNLDSKIFLPNTIVNSKIIIKEFENFLELSKKKSIPKLNVKIHPTSENMNKQIKLKSKLESIISNYGDRFDKNKKNRLSIVIGLTSSVVEILEHNIKVLHISSEPVFECYNQIFWPSIKTTQISKYIFIYKIVRKNNSLRFGTKKNQLKKYC